MALEGLLALLSGGMSGYGQGQQEYRAREAARNAAKNAAGAVTPPSEARRDDFVADFDRRTAALRQRYQQPYQSPFGMGRPSWQQSWSQRYLLLKKQSEDNPFGL